MDIYSAIVTGDRPPPHFLYRSTQWRLTAFVNRKVLEKYGPLPAFTHTVVTRIMENKLMPKEPDHLLVNEYNAGQGIMPHTGKCVTTPTGGEDIHDFDFSLYIDAPALFGPAILSLSLLSACVMKFTHVEKGNSVDILLRTCNHLQPPWISSMLMLIGF